jgi:2,4-dienoyl-CoA reductase-like NADH-dependent reductase (Old Yellow Enzyme family)/NADPH-dependent 2,4-dienoyl-CoA reductase/sulfur reductase-like enzyme
MHPRYPHVFNPVRLGPVEIPNRFYFAPQGIHLTVGSRPSTDYLHYQTARVRDHGCGATFCSLPATARGRTGQPCAYPRENVPSFRALADAVHDAGGRIFAQLWYWWGTTGAWQPYSPPLPPLSPSAGQYGFAEKTASAHAMSRGEIRAMTAAFGVSATHLREAGFDGIMLHAAHGGLIEHFNSPYFNRRTDEYGGSFANRMRFMTEVLETVRSAAGGGLAVGMRFNCDELLPGGYDAVEAGDIVRHVVRAGLVDFLDLDVAIEPNQLHRGMPPMFAPRHPYRPYVAALREAAGAVPVLSVLGRVTRMQDAEAAIASGLCDMVGASRQLIAEPDFVSNAWHGREARSRRCIACNWCMVASGDGAQGCAINPATMRERNWAAFGQATRRGKVVVVGGGPAGLEAARVCALRGHKVVLFEARAALGGALRMTADLPGREDFADAIDWWEGELERLGVDVRRGASADAGAVMSERPDAVVVATGARYSRGGRSALRDAVIPGHELPFVHRPEDILAGGVRPAGNVLILDCEGLHAGVGVAEVLAAAGAGIEFVTPGFAPVSARLQGPQHTPFVMQRLRAARVTFTPTSYIRRIEPRRVVLFDIYSGEEAERPVDAVVLATGRIPVCDLAGELAGKVGQLFTIGDALGARMVAAAVFEGQKFARWIGEPDAPRDFGEAFHAEPSPAFAAAPAETHGAAERSAGAAR